MKRIVIVGLLGMILFLNGCGRQEKVGICFRQNGDPVTWQLEEALRQALEPEGYRLIPCYAAMDQSRQHGQIRKLLQNRVDYLVVEPVIAAEMETVAALTAGQETQLIFLESQPEALTSGGEGVRFVSSRRHDAGKWQREILGTTDDEKIPGCLVITGPEEFLDGETWAADACEGFECLAVEYGDWTADNGRILAGRALGRFAEELNVIFCHNAQMALGALEAAKDYGRTVGKDLRIVALGLDSLLMEKIRSGEIAGTVCSDGQALAEGIVQCVLGRSTEQVIWVDLAKKPPKPDEPVSAE